MNTKKIAAVVLSAAILAISAAAFAATGDITPDADMDIPARMEPDAVQKLYYKPFRGTVKEITDYKPIDGAKFVSVESADGAPANIIIDNETYILDNEEIKVGSDISAYYDANAFMIMIYPAQYKAYVVVVKNSDRNVKADKFDEELVSYDNTLKLINVSEVENIVNEDGTAYEGDLADRVLVVVYGASTKSIPAQTTPDKIVVLAEDENDAQPVPEDETSVDVRVSDSVVLVNGNSIEAPDAFVSDSGVQMVPVRAVAEELGLEVVWNSADRSVALGDRILLKIGQDEFDYDGENRKLAAAAVIVDSRTFIPISFFDEIG